MTDAEFLDEIERRCAHGTVLTYDEYKRLCQLAGRVPATCDPVYVRQGGLNRVQQARDRLTAQMKERLRRR